MEGLLPSIESEHRDGVDIVRLSGEFDLSAADLLQQAFDGVDSRSRLVVVDLSEVRFFDSTALGLVVGLRRQLLSSGGRLALVVDGPEAVRVFQISGLDRIFSLTRSLDEAVALLSDSGA
jgi:anti-sigma B factor antagonist